MVVMKYWIFPIFLLGMFSINQVFAHGKGRRFYKGSVPFHRFSLPSVPQYITPSKYYSRPVGYPITPALPQFPAQLIRPATTKPKNEVVFGIGPQQSRPQQANQQQSPNVAFPANLNGNPSLPLFTLSPTSKPTSQTNSKPKTNANPSTSDPSQQPTKPAKSSGKNRPQSTAPAQFLQPLFLRPNQQSNSPLSVPLSVPSPISLPKLPGSPVSIPILKNGNIQPIGKRPEGPLNAQTAVYSQSAVLSPPTNRPLPTRPLEQLPSPSPIQEPAVTFLTPAEQSDPTTPLPVVTVTPESIVWSNFEEVAVGQPTEFNLIPIGTEASAVETTDSPTTFSPLNEIRPVVSVPSAFQPIPVIESLKTTTTTTTTPKPNRITPKSKLPKPHSRPNPKLRPYTRPLTSTTTASPFGLASESTTTTRKPYYTRSPPKDRLKSYSKEVGKESVQLPTQSPLVASASNTKDRNKSSTKRPETNWIEVATSGESPVNVSRDVKVTTESAFAVDTLGLNRNPEVTTQSRIPTESSSAVTEIFKESTSPANQAPVAVTSGYSKPNYQSQAPASQSFFNFRPDSEFTTPKSQIVLKSSPSGVQENPRAPSWTAQSPVAEPRPSFNQVKPVDKPVNSVKSAGSLPAASTSAVVYKNEDYNEYDDDYSAIPGQPGVDYPIYSDAPESQFSCSQQRLPGYYADPTARCQLFHVCLDDRQWSFLCPNGTIFSQQHFVCVWWYEFDCSQAASLYSLNERLYQVPSFQEAQQFTKSEVSDANKYIGKRDALEAYEDEEGEEEFA